VQQGRGHCFSWVHCGISFSTELESSAFHEEKLENDCKSEWHVNKYGSGVRVNGDLDYDNPKGDRYE